MAAAVALHDLLRRSGRFARWEQFDGVLRTFVGRADSMTFAQLGAVLAAAGVRSPADLKRDEALDIGAELTKIFSRRTGAVLLQRAIDDTLWQGWIERPA